MLFLLLIFKLTSFFSLKSHHLMSCLIVIFHSDIILVFFNRFQILFFSLLTCLPSIPQFSQRNVFN